MFPFPVLLCDIGGTNCRFGWASEPDAPVRLIESVRTADHATFADACRLVMDAGKLQPASLIVCAAGPASGRCIDLTNAAWTIDGPEVVAELGLEQGLLLNDFEALALSLPSLKAEWLRPVIQTPGDPRGVRLVLGPGTGLGMSAMISTGRRYLALPTEAGHVSLAPVGEEQEAIWSTIERVHGRITAESVLSGPGLARLHNARCRVLGAKANVSAATDAPGTAGGEVHAAEITKAAIADRESEEAATVRLFWKLAAQFAGDMAITFTARGGITLAGGVLPRILPLLDREVFAASFTAKAPMQALAGSVPVHLLDAEGAVLHGMAALASSPDRYVIDYAERQWC